MILWNIKDWNNRDEIAAKIIEIEQEISSWKKNNERNHNLYTKLKDLTIREYHHKNIDTFYYDKVIYDAELLISDNNKNINNAIQYYDDKKDYYEQKLLRLG